MLSGFFSEVGRVTILASQVMRLLVKSIIHGEFFSTGSHPTRILPTPLTKRIILQLVEVGVNTIPLLLIMSGFFGMVLAYLTYGQFKRVEMEMYTGSLVGASMVTELGPIIVAILVAGRIGSQTAATISTMKTTEQIDALKTMAVNPVEYLVLPRLIATVIMMPILTIFADVVGTIGGWVVAVGVFSLSSSLYIKRMIDFLNVSDLTSGLIKSLVFGVIIIIMSSYKGFRSEEGAAGVGMAVTSAVVLSIASVLVADYFLTVILF
ncbi:MAG: ABC transporter permease [bacterium]|nr:ABC transporter permease [bacterium]